MLLVLVDAEYRFFWVDCGSSLYSSDAQILRGKIGDGTLGLLASEPFGEGGPDLHHFLLGDDAFALMPWMVKPYSRRQLTREERIANYRISRGKRVVENVFGILVSRFRVLLGIMEQRPKVVKYIVFTRVVLHNMLRTHQVEVDRASTPGNNVKAKRNEQVVYVPNDNYRNPLSEAKRQQGLLKDCFSPVGALAAREDRI